MRLSLRHRAHDRFRDDLKHLIRERAAEEQPKQTEDHLEGARAQLERAGKQRLADSLGIGVEG
jgi:hypothetical protein